MAWILCTSGQAVNKAGANANAAIILSGQPLAEWSDEAEQTVCMKTRKDWITTPPTSFVSSIADVVSDLIAIKIINYDMSGYTSRAEAQTMLDVLKDNSDNIIKDLREKQYQEVME